MFGYNRIALTFWRWVGGGGGDGEEHQVLIFGGDISSPNLLNETQIACLWRSREGQGTRLKITSSCIITCSF